MVYSFSKDLNSSGIRLGICVTQANTVLRNSIAAQKQFKLSSFTSVAAAHLLQDKIFLSEIAAANPDLLRSNFYVTQSFLEYHGVFPTAGVFIFSNFLAITGRPVTGEEEIKLEGEFRDQGIRINSFNQSGIFLIDFCCGKGEMITGLHRIEATVRGDGWSLLAIRNLVLYDDSYAVGLAV